MSLTNPKSWNPALWNLYGGGQTEAGITVDENSALNLAAVYAAINIISGDISTLPLGLFKTVKNKRKRITDHKSLQVLTNSSYVIVGKYVWGDRAGWVEQRHGDLATDS